MTWILFSKIYFEFFVFCLYLIRLDLTNKKSLLLIGFLVTLIFLTGEGNLFIILAWRLLLYFYRAEIKGPFFFTLLVLLLAVDVLFFKLLSDFDTTGLISRFEYTRTIANPDYSILETLMVFFTSFHLFTLHTSDFLILDALFAIPVLAPLLIDAGCRKKILDNLHLIILFVFLVLFFTMLTHAFQNARYYYMYIVLLSMIYPNKYLPWMCFCGVFHFLMKYSEIFLN